MCDRKLCISIDSDMICNHPDPREWN